MRDVYGLRTQTLVPRTPSNTWACGGKKCYPCTHEVASTSVHSETCPSTVIFKTISVSIWNIRIARLTRDCARPTIKARTRSTASALAFVEIGVYVSEYEFGLKNIFADHALQPLHAQQMDMDLLLAEGSLAFPRKHSQWAKRERHRTFQSSRATPGCATRCWG
jgi:hypothetical protein